MEIELTANEILVAGYIGMRRNAEATFKGRKYRFPERYVGEFWSIHIESAHAELSVCKYLGIYWGFGVNTFHTPDIVNTPIEVRWSTHKSLKIRPDDNGIVVSVSGSCPKYKIEGWIKAEDGKKEKYLYEKPPPCYFVPHNDLNSPELLKEYMRNKPNNNKLEEEYEKVPM